MYHIFVVGAGAVGGYFGARLAAAGEPVTFVCRGKTREAIRRGGLRIESVAGDLHLRPPTVERPDGSVQADLILWAVKEYHNREAFESVRPLVGERTTVLSLQNGVDPVDELADAFGARKIVGGFAGLAAGVVEPGRIRHTAMGQITLGELDGAVSERVRAIAQRLEKAGVPHRVSENIRRDLWGKLAWNAAFNPLSVILRATVEELLNDLAALSILKRAMEEVVAVAKAEGHELSPRLLQAYLNPPEPAKGFLTSMLQDFLKGRPMEVDAISGAVVRCARRRNVSVPVNEMYYDLLRYWDLRPDARFHLSAS
ncbi:MAG: hypothetical protein A3G34_14530 [Candidatus Lindowbacteria bacterium RIFCSPLOWO2_12_FULL_62_27]|nr:MAG: hypothetical protein A3I06_15940 [Candidatus Lindowbacteria bacterium RIFCSPLOWO2_02_FULL_62_12]OGH63079.1 MAG: hypothetical protein A3G34_14530 [Candidatus Lindowbacteria bacterium RIFCSPLOWO2_12_FULL_62_27]